MLHLAIFWNDFEFCLLSYFVSLERVKAKLVCTLLLEYCDNTIGYDVVYFIMESFSIG